MFILGRLISAASRSLAVMIGFGGSAHGAEPDRLRGSPDEAMPFAPPPSVPQYPFPQFRKISA